MVLIVQPAVPADVPELIEVYYLAFQNPFAVNAFPDVPSVRKWWLDSIAEEIKDPNALFLKVVGDDSADKTQIIAWAKWNKPVANKPEDPMPAWPEGSDVDLCNEFFSQTASMHKKLFEGRPHWYLEMLATHPDHQGHGAGSLLIDYVCRQADKDGVEGYLEASPAGVRLYQKFGFESVGKLEMGIKGESFWNLFMTRKPQK